MNADLILFSGLQILFYIITLIFIIFSLSLAYHWFTYGSSRNSSVLTIAVFLLGSAPFFILMAAALRMM